MITGVFSFRHLARIFFKDKFFSILNILGLSLGISISLIVLLVIDYDISYDEHYKKHQNIYRLGASIHSKGVDHRSSRSAQELSTIIQEEYPEIMAITRINASGASLIQIDGDRHGKERTFREPTFQTDSAYFYIFDHEFVLGDPYTCFRQNNGVVLTESKSRDYFDKRNPLGELLTINGEPKIITGVIKDLPGNTHLKFNILSAGLEDRGSHPENEMYWTPNVFTYLLLPEGYSPESFIDRFKHFYAKHLKPFGDKIEGSYTPTLERLDKIHFASTLERDLPRGNLFNLVILVSISCVILILSIINYTNLATIRSLSRASEIAVRKVFGSKRCTIALSVLVESIFYSFVSMIVSVGLVLTILQTDFFYQITARHFEVGLQSNPMLVFLAVAIAIGAGMLAGSYPSFYISKINASQVLQGKFKSKSSFQTFKKVLITVQFCLSIIVVIFMLVMNQQIDHLKNKDVGFDVNNIIVVPFYGPNTVNSINTFKTDALKHHAILGAAVGQSPGSEFGALPFLAETKSGMETRDIKVLYVGDDYLKTFGIELIVGKNFPAETNFDDESVFLVNESTAKLMEWSDDAVGKKIKFLNSETVGSVIGVVKDFNFESVFTRIEPLVIVKSNQRMFLHLKVEPKHIDRTVKFLSDRWSSYHFAFPFEYHFLDEYFNRPYLPHEMQYRLITILSGLCIFISLLGAFGLSAFSAVQKTREIAIRRVHGASKVKVTLFLYKELMGLVALSSVIISPITYLAVDQWLDNFAYPVEIDFRLFAFVISATFLLTFCVVVFNTLKICRARPADILKYE